MRKRNKVLITSGTAIGVVGALLFAFAQEQPTDIADEMQLDTSQTVVQTTPTRDRGDYWAEQYNILYDDEKLLLKPTEEIQLADAGEDSSVDSNEEDSNTNEDVTQEEVKEDSTEVVVAEEVKTPVDEPQQQSAVPTASSNQSSTPAPTKPKVAEKAPEQKQAEVVQKIEETQPVISVVDTPSQTAPEPKPTVPTPKPEPVEEKVPTTAVSDAPAVPSIPELTRVQEVLATSSDEQYRKAQLNWGTGSGTLTQDFIDKTAPYRNMTKDEIQQLFNALDMVKMNQIFTNLINNFRAENGVAPLVNYTEFITGSTQVAKELADYGYTAENGQKPHTRPAPHTGKPTRTLFAEAGVYNYTGIGENSAFLYSRNNPYVLVSEQFLAEYLFQKWKDSPGHRRNMLHEAYTGHSFAVYPVMHGNTKVGAKNADGAYIITGNARESSGFGIMAINTLIRK